VVAAPVVQMRSRELTTNVILGRKLEITPRL